MNFLHKIPIFFFSLLYPIKVYGKENIPKGGAVIACNHFRAIDCGFIARIFKGDTKYLAKQELFSNKLFAKIIKSYGAIPIDRDNPDMKSLLQAMKEIKSGNKLCIFPEGKRNTSGTNELQEIKSGAVVFSVKSKSPIIPVMIFSKSKILRKTHIIIGKPFEFSEYYGKKLTEEDIDAMAKILVEKMIEQQDVLKNILNKNKEKS